MIVMVIMPILGMKPMTVTQRLTVQVKVVIAIAIAIDIDIHLFHMHVPQQIPRLQITGIPNLLQLTPQKIRTPNQLLTCLTVSTPTDIDFLKNGTIR
jgi:hypothetical protein